MVEKYLASRKTLAGVVLILDIRRTPCAEDLLLLQLLRSFSIPCLPVITKCDKVSKNERAKQTAVIARSLELDKGELSFFSALSKEGRDQLWERIEGLLSTGAQVDQV
jgi:GTP-binding protein